MLSVCDSIHGWSPIGDEDEDVIVSHDMCFMTIKPFSTPSNALNPAYPPLNATSKSCSPKSNATSTTGVAHPSSSSDRRIQRNRNRDPSWIPRPRNAFIIFRCEYSREHSHGAGQDYQSDDDPTNPTVKTLSKRAAEAWKQLPPSEREHYKELADKEREEHARLYPHYRFRPMKRQNSGGRKPSRERSQGPTRVSSQERSARAPSTPSHVPSVLTSAPTERGGSSPMDDQGEAFSPAPCAAAALSLPEHHVDARAEAPLSVNYDDLLLSYPLSEEMFKPPFTSLTTAPVELFAPSHQTADSIPPNTFHRCDDAVFGVDPTLDDTGRTQAPGPYEIGVCNYDLFPPFAFPEYY